MHCVNVKILGRIHPITSWPEPCVDVCVDASTMFFMHVASMKLWGCGSDSSRTTQLDSASRSNMLYIAADQGHAVRIACKTLAVLIAAWPMPFSSVGAEWLGHGQQEKRTFGSLAVLAA